MQVIYPDRSHADGWAAGPWNSRMANAIRRSGPLAEEPHYHTRMREVCLVLAGSGEVMAQGRISRVETGALVIVEAREVHAWQRTSRDFQAVVIYEPWVVDDTVVVARV